MQRMSTVSAALAAFFLVLPLTAGGSEAPVLVWGDASSLSFDVQVPHGGATLTVTGPDGLAFRRAFAGEPAAFALEDLGTGSPPDGLYTYELVLSPPGEELHRAAERVRASADGLSYASSRGEGAAVSGYFTVTGGSLSWGGAEEAAFEGASANAGLENVSGATQVIPMDLIVQGSECVGFDCSSTESFGSDTIRLKENNLRIHFDDTSVSAGFPANDWRIVANDQASGGANYLGFENSTANNFPFRVLSTAGANALHVGTSGNVGLGTATPALELQIADGDSPGLRLEQTVASGFAAQSWDVVGNETSFFVRDVTNGSTLPFRIFPSAPSSSLVVASTTGDVGMGTTSPGADLHVLGTDGGTDFLVEEASATEAARVLATLRNNGRALLLLQDTSADGTIWRWRTVENSMNLDADSGTGNELTLTSTGNMTILGTLTQNSNREAKTRIQAVDPQEVLAKVTAMPLATWAYKQSEDELHLGPMAQDFYDAFGLGAGNLGVAPYDTAGVALAAVQALSQQLEEKQQKIDLLEARLAALEAKAAD